MKILCVGRNYSEHAKELGNAVPENPVIFSKPDTALLKNGEPFYIPDFSNDVHHEIELVIKINKVGKKIQEKFARNYFSEIGLGIDFTARDKQNELKTKGLPWELAKAFDGSAPIGNFINIESVDLKNIDLLYKSLLNSLQINILYEKLNIR
jgi:2-keto-4-pentenoate hydratase/2-oxohepta-3-ene-1,7-dioic acid hydratase in catechol pathway